MREEFLANVQATLKVEATREPDAFRILGLSLLDFPVVSLHIVSHFYLACEDLQLQLDRKPIPF